MGFLELLLAKQFFGGDSESLEKKLRLANARADAATRAAVLLWCGIPDGTTIEAPYDVLEWVDAESRRQPWSHA